jgi:hypothetical protein
MQNPLNSPLLQMRFRSGLKNMLHLLKTLCVLPELDITAVSIVVIAFLVLLLVQIL